MNRWNIGSLGQWKYSVCYHNNIYMSVWKWKWKSLHGVQLFVTLWTLQSMEFFRPDTGVGSCSLLQGIFPTQGSNPSLLHCRQILYQLSHQGSPRILEWIAYPFSSRSSHPRNWTRVSCIAGRFFTSWATREAHQGLTITAQVFCMVSQWGVPLQGMQNTPNSQPHAPNEVRIYPLCY